MKLVARLFLTLMLSFLITSLHAEDKATTKVTPPPSGATISGKATIELRIDVTKNLKGLELVLIPESAVKELKEIRNKRWLESASRLKFNAGYFYLDLKSIGYFAATNAVSRTKSNAEATFSFVGLQPGSYRIYGQYKSRYAAGYWLVPIEVKTTEDAITVDLNNENLEEIYNRELR